MSILLTIKNDQIAARKARNTLETDTLTTLYSEALMIGKNDGGRDTTDAEVIAVVKKFLKNVEECIKLTQPHEVDRLTDYMSEEIILNKYIPSQLTEVEIRSIIKGNSLSTLPSIMAHFKTHHAGLYDGKALSSMAKEMI